MPHYASLDWPAGVTLYRGVRATAHRRVTLHQTLGCASRPRAFAIAQGRPASLGGLEELDIDARHPEDNCREALAPHDGALRDRDRRDHRHLQPAASSPESCSFTQNQYNSIKPIVDQSALGQLGGIFANNFMVVVRELIPVLGPAVFALSIYETARIVEVIAITNGDGVAAALGTLFLLPHTYLELPAYAIAVTESGYLVYAIAAGFSKGWAIFVRELRFLSRQHHSDRRRAHRRRDLRGNRDTDRGLDPSARSRPSRELGVPDLDSVRLGVRGGAVVLEKCEEGGARAGGQGSRGGEAPGGRVVRPGRPSPTADAGRKRYGR